MTYLLRAVFLVTSLSLCSCSVFMAATGSPEVEWDVLKKGNSRTNIEEQFGKPITFIRRSWGDEATYQFVEGVEPSYWRAALYGTTTVLTAGLGELVTTPMESTRALQGNRQTVIVTYDLNGFVRDYDVASEEAVLPPTGEMLGMSSESEEANEQYEDPVTVARGQYSGARMEAANEAPAPQIVAPEAE